MLHQRLATALTISYYNVLCFGLMPTKFQLNNSRLRVTKPSIGYLIYSVCLTVLLLLPFPRMMPRLTDGYIKNNIVLQWSLIVNVVLRIYAILSCYGLVWVQRFRLRKLCRDFVSHWKSDWSVLRRIVGEEAMEKLQLKMANMLIWKLSVSYAQFFCFFLIQYRLDSDEDLLEYLERAFQMLMISVVRIGFYSLLVLISHQFDAVQLALQALHRRVGGYRSLEDVRRLAKIHDSWMQLARRAFRLCDVATTSILVNIFSSITVILYHAVQFGNKTIESDIVDTLVGESLVILSLLMSIMVTNIVDYALNSCNNAGQLLRQFSDLRRVSPESQMELELFATRLHYDRLTYRICGCVVLDKPACLGYFASVLNQVIVLMQFDLNRRHKQRMIDVQGKN